jgi:ABC-2 type transport system ATP-binding protein
LGAALSGNGLELRGLSKRFGKLQAVDDLSFDVRPGEVFGFVGSNGAGKTTTMRMALGTQEPDAGEILWGGKPIDFDVRRRIGYMPEERGLYPKMRIGDQLEYLAQLHGATAEGAHEAVTRWLDRFGLGGRTRDEVQKLSHGNQQRVQLAAALAFEPVMLVLDEPFAGLDPEAVDSMSEVLHERAVAGTPVLFSSHQLDLVERICDRVGIIQKGRMVATGTVDELRSHGPERYWVDVPAAGAEWVKPLAGVEVVRTQGTRYLVELTDGTGDQAVLQAALRTGPVHEFRRDLPSLLDIFREAMTEGREPSA